MVLYGRKKKEIIYVDTVLWFFIYLNVIKLFLVKLVICEFGFF